MPITLTVFIACKSGQLIADTNEVHQPSHKGWAVFFYFFANIVKADVFSGCSKVLSSVWDTLQKLPCEGLLRPLYQSFGSKRKVAFV